MLKSSTLIDLRFKLGKFLKMLFRKKSLPQFIRKNFMFTKRSLLGPLLLFYSILSSLIFISCEETAQVEKNKDNLILLRSIAEEFVVLEKRTPTKKIDFGESPNGFLVSGWSHAEKGRRWAIGLESKLNFISINQDKNINIRLRCHGLPFSGLPKQSVKIFLNSHFVNKIVMDSSKSVYDFELPVSFLKNGMNLMSFKYAYSKKPSETSDSTDSRNLSVCFNSMEFGGNGTKQPETIKCTNKRIIQERNTLLNYYTFLPSNSFLEFYFDNKGSEMGGCVTISSDVASPKSYYYDKCGEQKIDLNAYSNKFIQITFSANFLKNQPSELNKKSTNSVEWCEPNISILEPSGTDADFDKNSVKKDVSKKIKEYDVIYLVLDAFNAKHSSLYGYNRKTTPFMDGLSEEAVVFENMFSNAPYTLASTGSLFTSTYSHEHGLITDKDRLSPILPTIAGILSNTGVETYLISGHSYFQTPWGLTRGFSKVFFDRKLYFSNADNIISALKNIYGSVESEKRKFIYIHMIPPHGPYLPPKRFRKFNKPNPVKELLVSSSSLKEIDDGKKGVNKEDLEYIISMYDANVLFADDIARKLHAYLKI